MEELDPHERQFADDVFPAEIAEIRRRRRNLDDRRPLPGEVDAIVPSTTLGLVGLAFSGGGIRSASFCLGVVQSLTRLRLFPRVDYLSTVSGGASQGRVSVRSWLGTRRVPSYSSSGKAQLNLQR